MNIRRLGSLAVAVAVAATALVTLAAQPYPRNDVQRAWNAPFEPFRIIGPIHYVGTADLASFLITSDAGHILLDTGLEEPATQLVASIERLGFKVSDIKVLLNSQSHFDHAAGFAALKKRSGARLLASAKDAPVLEAGGKNDPALEGLAFPAVKVDGHIEDGQVVTVGPLKLTAHLTPGHTKGTTTWEMTVRDQNRDLRVLFVGSTSIVPDVSALNNPKYPEIRADLDRTYAKLKTFQPDIFLSQHAGYYGLADKFAKLKAGATPNPFIDPDGYKAQLARLEEAYRRVR
jgi:metallo-beta-lactamase class B